jgi:serine/threonine protein kinase
LAVKNTLGPYVLDAELGRGGGGTVWDALDTRLDRRVALKLVRVEASDPRVERARREAQIQARLSHPNVVKLYEAGFEQGFLFLAMELVKGTSLRAELVRCRDAASRRLRRGA